LSPVVLAGHHREMARYVLLLVGLLVAGCGGIRTDAPTNLTGIWNGDLGRGAEPGYLDFQFVQAATSETVTGTARLWTTQQGNATVHQGQVTGTYRNGLFQGTVQNFNPAVPNTAALTMSGTFSQNAFTGNVIGGIGARTLHLDRFFPAQTSVTQGSVWNGPYAEGDLGSTTTLTVATVFGARVFGAYAIGAGSVDAGGFLGTRTGNTIVGQWTSTTRGSAPWTSTVTGNSMSGQVGFGPGATFNASRQ
jgi:hypothetical protein